MTIALGCDPGLSGAISLVCTQRGLLACEDLPTCSNGTETGSMKRWIDARALDLILKDWSFRFDFARDVVHAAIERPIPMPSLPAQTIASQFDTFGCIRGLIASKTWGAHLKAVNPKEWQKGYGLGKGDKSASRACCLRLYPGAPVALVKHADRAESILIARWALAQAGAWPTEKDVELMDSF